MRPNPQYLLAAQAYLRPLFFRVTRTNLSETNKLASSAELTVRSWPFKGMKGFTHHKLAPGAELIVTQGVEVDFATLIFAKHSKVFAT